MTSPRRSCASENNTIKICDVPPTGVTVQRGPTMDGLGEYYREIITESDEQPVDVVAALREAAGRRAGVLPAGRLGGRRTASTPSARSTPGSRSSTRCRCSSPPTRRGRRSSPTPACRSSATTSSPRSAPPSRTGCMAKLFEDRGVELLRTYQLNFGGNMDFMNMLERKRLQSKKISKTQSVTSQIPHEMARADVHIGPSRPRAVAGRPQVGLRPPGGPVLRRHPAEPGVQARGLGLAELRRRHHRRRPRAPRSPRTAASAARSCRPRSYFMKSPPEQYSDDTARDAVDKFISGRPARPS